MVGGTDHLETPSYQSAESGKSMTLLRYLLIIINTIFAGTYVIVTIWQSTIYWFYIILVPLYFMLLWVSYSSKLSEYDRQHKRGILPELDVHLHILGFFGNLIALVILIASIILEPSLDFFVFVVPISMATFLDYENLGSFLAFNRVTKNN